MTSPRLTPETPRRRPFPLGKRLLFVILTVGFVAVVTGPAYSAGLAAVVLPFALAIALQFLPYFWSDETDPFEPAATLGLYSALALVSTLSVIVLNERVQVQWLPGLSPSALEDLVATVGWAYVVGAISYYVGYYAAVGRRFVPWFPNLQGVEWSPPRLAVGLGLLAAIAVPTYAIFQGRVGGSLTDVTNLAAAKSAIQDDPTETWITRGILLGLLPPMIYLAWVATKSKRTSQLVLAWFLVAFAALLIVRTSQRGVAIFFILTCLAIFHYLRRRIPTALVVSGVFIALVGSNILLDFRRTDVEVRGSSVTSQRFQPTEALEEHEKDRNRLSTLCVVFHTFPDRHDYLLGESWLALASAPIPRWLWPDKKYSFVWRETYMMVHLRGKQVPVPYVGLLYANFSWVGIVLGMAMSGVFHRALYDWMRQSGKDKSVVLIYANLMLVASPTLFALQNVIQYALPLYIFIRLVGMRVPASKVAPALRARPEAS